MKKILSLILVLVLSSMTMTGALASMLVLPEQEFAITVTGMIEATEPMICLQYPSGINWYASAKTKNAGGTYDIESATYEIRNISGLDDDGNLIQDEVQTTDLKVTLLSFDTINAGGLVPDTEYELHMVGDLREGDIGANLQRNYDGDASYTAILDAGDTWTFSFGGEYKHKELPLNAIEPLYEMVLHFAISSVNRYTP